MIFSAFFFGALKGQAGNISWQNTQTAPSVYTISYELNGGENSILNPVTFKKEELPISLESPRKSGYHFIGWYEDAAFSRHISEITEASDKKLYAKWTLEINANQNVQDYPYRQGERTLLLKNLSYRFLDHLDTPGNPKTRISDLEEQKYASEYQCPQGLCFTEDYIVVSSYALEEGALGALTFYERDSGQYLMSFGMEADSHLGGIAYDGSTIWICHSNTRKLEAISYDFLKRLLRVSNQNFVDITKCFAQYEVENIPSCITCYDGVLYVATHHVYTPGSIFCYQRKNDALVLQDAFLVPSKVQGIAVDEEKRIWLSRSYGRKKSSYLAIYQDMERLRSHMLEPDYEIEMPPGAEELVVENEVCAILFETASYKYLEGSDGKGICDYPIDKLLLLDCNSIWYD